MASHSRTPCCWLLLLAICVLAPPLFGQQTRVYVDGENGVDAGTGSSWATAFKTIDRAINRSLSTQAAIQEIWIKGGTYKPATKTSTWRFPIGVNVYGGFAGTETSLDDRIPYQNETILSADLAGDDNPLDFDSFDDNMTSEIVRMDVLQPQSPTGSRESIIDQLVFEGVHLGPWMVVSTWMNGCSHSDGPITVSRCTFRNSFPDTLGTAMVQADGSIRFIACEFVENYGITIIEDCCPYSPTALSILGCEDVESPSISNCLFANNSVIPIALGGASFESPNTVQNCIFLNNTPLFVGAMIVSDYADVVNSTFVNCYATAPQWGEGWIPDPPYIWGLVQSGSFASAEANLKIMNCVVSDSSPIFEMSYFENDAPGYPPGVDRTIEYSVFNSAVGGGTAGPGVIADSVTFSSPGGFSYTLAINSPGIDAGDSTQFKDYIIGPYDYYAAPRYYDIAAVGNTGLPSPNHPLGMIDMGAVERQCDYCIGDLNCDAKTNTADFNLFAAHFGQTTGATRADGDLTGDGAVNTADFNLLAGDLGCDANQISRRTY